MTGCSIDNPSSVKSTIDSRFILQNLKRQNSEQTKSQGILFYQKGFSKILATECTMIPHDSFKTQLVYQTCGPFTSILSSMDRLYLEPDAPKLGLPIIWENNQLHYWDMNHVCH